MPPRRRPQAAGGNTSSTAPKGRQSKLARENNISAEEETDIREAFSLFSEPMEGEREGVMPIGDVRRAMIALGIPPRDNAELADFVSVLDPEDEGFATYPAFVAVCALKLRTRDGTTDEAHEAELDEAFGLFTAGQPGAQAITLTHLQRIATLLREDVTEDLLRDMILEGNGGAGIGRGVRKDEFDGVMRRAGVWR